MMDPAVWVLGLGTASLVVWSFRSGRTGRQRDLSDLMSGLFGGPHEPSWPPGVQEEDTIRPWVGPGSPADSIAEPDRSPIDATADLIGASLEDGAEPIEVSRVRRAA
jgi:hypothetical protein